MHSTETRFTLKAITSFIFNVFFQVAVGHSSGYISMLDIRTGRLKTGLKVGSIGMTQIKQNIFLSEKFLSRLMMEKF